MPEQRIALAGSERRRSRTRRAIRRRATAGIAAGLVGGIVLLPFDGAIEALANAARRGIGGDVVRELGALQQFGQGVSIVVIAAAVWLLDPSRRRRLLDWGLAIALLNAIVLPMKILIARPRPAFGVPADFLGPLGAHPLPNADPPGVYHAWELAAPISSNLWSMPSSHTAHAVLAAVFLGVLYPRLRPLVIALAAAVGCARMVFGAHYASDVAGGAGLGFGVGVLATRRYWGVRALDLVWRRFVERKKRTALWSAVRFERRCDRMSEVA